MNPPDEPRHDDAALDAAWRSVREDSAPSPAVRATILAEAARAAAAARAAQDGQRFDRAAPAANDGRWKLRAAAAVAVLGLVGLIAQQALRQRPVATSALAPSPAPVEVAPAVAPDLAPAAAPPAAVLAPPPPPREEPAPAMRAERIAPPVPAVPAAPGAGAPATATAEAARMAKAVAPVEPGTWARDTEALLHALLARRGIAPDAVSVGCASDRCNIAGAADAVRALLQSPELAGRLRVAVRAPVAGILESDAQPGTVRYTLERVDHAQEGQR